MCIRDSLTAVTMPCFGTTQRTRSNAEVMAREVGADFRVIDIQKATLQHMSDIGLSVEDRSTAYENAQARERTQVLMDIANAEMCIRDSLFDGGVARVHHQG